MKGLLKKLILKNTANQFFVLKSDKNWEGFLKKKEGLVGWLF